MGSERVTYFSTDAADQCFLNEFVLGVGAVLGGEINKAADLYNDIRVLWYNVEKMLAALKGEDADESAEESSLVEDVRFAVEHTLEQLWETDTPLMASRSLSGRRIPLKMRAIETAYTKQHTKAQAAITEPPVVPAAAFAPSMGAFLDQAVARMNGAPLESIPEEGPA